MPSLFVRALRAVALAVLATLVALLPWPAHAGAEDPSLPIADLEAGILSSATPIDGQDLTYTITAKNNGPAADTSVSLTQTLPTNSTFKSADADSCQLSQDGKTVTCTQSTPLASGAAATFQVVVTPTKPGTTSSQVSVTGSPDTNVDDPSNNSATDNTTVAPAADLSLSLAHTPDHPSVGADVSFFAGVTNKGPDTAANVKVTDVLPDGLTFQTSPGCTETDGTVTCIKPSLASGDTTFFEIKVKPTRAGQITNSATVSSSAFDPQNGDNTDSDTIGTAQANLSLTDTIAPAEPQQIRVGEAFDFVLKVSNAGPDAAANLKVTDKLPAGLTFQPSAGCTAAGQVVTCTATSPLANGADKTFNVTVKASKSGTYTDDASVTSDATDSDSSNNSDSASATVMSMADLSMAVAGSSGADGTLTYSLGVHNNGPDAAEGVKVVATLPSGTSFVSADDSCSLSGGKVTCVRDSLGNDGETAFVLKLTSTKPGSYVLTATASTGSTDPTSTNDEATGTATVSPAPAPPVATPSADLGIRVSRDAPRLVRGFEAVYTLGAVNHGPSTASNAKITATLPSNVTFVSASSGCTHSGTTVTCALGSLNSGARASRAIRVRPNRTGTTSTRATITSSVRDPDTSDNSDSDTAYVEEPSASRGKLVVCKVSRTGSVCTVRYDGKGRPKVTGSLKRGTKVYATGSTRSGRPLRLRTSHRIREGKYKLVRTYNGRKLTFDDVYVVVVR